jgi:hypothetical protein
MSKAASEPHFQIFRKTDARELMESGIMSILPYTPIQAKGVKAVKEASAVPGSKTKVLFNIPGFSLLHAWFKAGYPLALHSHDSDCLYYIVAGSLRLGTEELGPQEGFFIPANVPYSYTPGPKGVEVLEFRHATSFHFNVLAKGEAFWERAAKTVAAHSEDWTAAKMPSETPV